MTNDYVIVQDEAWHKSATKPNGLDYQDANTLVSRLQQTALGRLYIDDQGNVVYESRYYRTLGV